MNKKEIEDSLYVIKEKSSYNLEILQNWFVISFILKIKKQLGIESDLMKPYWYMKYMILYFTYIIHTSENRENFIPYMKLQCSPFWITPLYFKKEMNNLQDIFEYVYKNYSISQIEELINWFPLNSIEREISIELKQTLDYMEKIWLKYFHLDLIREKWADEFIHYFSTINRLSIVPEDILKGKCYTTPMSKYCFYKSQNLRYGIFLWGR